MKKLLTHCFAGASLFVCASSLSAAVFLDENFDSYADQTAFQASWGLIGSSTVLNNEQSVSLGQSIKGLTTATRNVRSLGEIGFLNGNSDVVVFRFNFYDSDASLAPYRQYAELNDGAAPGSGGQLFAMGLNNNLTGTKYMARILGADGGSGSGAFFRLDDVGAPDRTTGWHSLQANISDNDVKYYVDGILSKTVNISALTDRSLDTVRVGSGLT